MLRRFQAAMSFYVTGWVSRTQRTELLTTIQTAVTSQLSELDDVTVEFGAQEWYQYTNPADQTSMTIVRYNFFVLVKNSIINGQLESAFDASSLEPAVTLAHQSAIAGAVNLRNSFSLNIEGFIPQVDIDDGRFETALNAIWSEVNSDLSVTFARKLELIGDRG